MRKESRADILRKRRTAIELKEIASRLHDMNRLVTAFTVAVKTMEETVKKARKEMLK